MDGDVEYVSKLDWRFCYSTDNEIRETIRQTKIICEHYKRPFSDEEIIKWALGNWKPVI